MCAVRKGSPSDDVRGHPSVLKARPCNEVIHSAVCIVQVSKDFKFGKDTKTAYDPDGVLSAPSWNPGIAQKPKYKEAPKPKSGLYPQGQPNV